MVDRQDDHSDMLSGRPLEEAIVEEFAVSFRGEIIRPQDDRYEEARKIYNGMIDKRPALIVRPTGSADVIDAVNLARENRLPLAVRCGGHSVAGKGVVDDGVLIDLSSLKGVRVDPTSRRARAGKASEVHRRESQGHCSLCGAPLSIASSRGGAVLIRVRQGATRVQDGFYYACRARLIDSVRPRSSYGALV